MASAIRLARNSDTALTQLGAVRHLNSIVAHCHEPQMLLIAMLKAPTPLAHFPGMCP
jgi:hypothetical protein